MSFTETNLEIAKKMAEKGLKPCYCGNFGDDGPDDYCDHSCMKEDCEEQSE